MSFGSVGYRDGQRTIQQDATIPAWSLNGTFNANQVSGPLPTQGFAQTILGILMVGGGMRLTWTSWVDQGETEALGQQTLVLDSLVNTFCSIAVPNLGPYVGFTARLLAGYANYTPQLFALMTNKARPTTALPLQALWTGSGNSIAISGNTVEYAPFYYGGAAGMIVVGGSTQTTFQLQAEDSGGTWQVVWAQTVGALTIANVQPVMLPLAPLRMKVINASSTAADAAWQFQVVPDLSVV